jgi:hypothetical protein
LRSCMRISFSSSSTRSSIRSAAETKIGRSRFFEFSRRRLIATALFVQSDHSKLAADGV